MAGDKEGTSKAIGNDGTDPTSPYYLHPSEHPNQMHVNEALNDHNYLDWVQEMETFLLAKNKIGFVDGTIPKPNKTDDNHKIWLRCDAMLRSWLNAAMEKEIRISVKYASSAEEIWRDLRDRFGKESAPRAYELKQLLMTTRQDGSSVSAYYTRLRTLWDEIGSVFSIPRCSCTGCTCEVSKRLTESRDKERLYEFLLGLDNEFSTIRTQILAMKPTPTLGEAYHLVSEDEQQKIVSSGKKTNNDSAAFHTSLKKEGAGNSQNRNTYKNNKRTTDEKVEHCTFCDKDGHNRDGCFKLIGYPEWWPGKGKTEKGRSKAAYVGSAVKEPSPSGTSSIPGLSEDQYKQLIYMIKGKNEADVDITQPMANMAGLEYEEIDWNG